MGNTETRNAKLRKLLIGELSWKRLARSIAFIYTFFALYVFFRADSMIFLPQPATYQDTQEILKLPVTETEKISALHLPNPQSAYTLLYIHGNAEDLGDIRPVLERLQGWGFSVFSYDYRGYGTSDGKPSERNAYQDADAAYQYLTQQLKIPPQQIIIYGRSVGGGSATELATQYPVAGLILESTFTSAFRVVVPFPLLPFDKFSNLNKLQQVQCPILIMHGQADSTIPIEHGKTLYNAAPEPKLSLWVAEAGHDDFTWVAGERHQQALLSFQTLAKKNYNSLQN
ncbi:alpha/beta hydrolase [Lusitaniella coriacea LEGE 07157]|uniref:Alpha/beta hydrolase n=1 Tax=Lusitaniella coriacea LEGE 07157 TaxID=945747 RepID=A0A8J7DWD1_9CYAN|nr:alpha/beta hydrolase [Lusitaniella coriacea]MBE9116013.1 alpha/beta hydrolase [Lusitaniella coriacea LEGE 07157]